MSESPDQKAVKMLRKIRQPVSDKEHPLLDLVVCSLSPDGLLEESPEGGLNYQSYNEFLRLEFDDPDQVDEELKEIIDQEDMPVPDNPDDLAPWAEDLVLQFLADRNLIWPSR